MILIDEILVSEDIFSNHFACHLSACKGDCCIEGDFGAPLSEAETKIIQKHIDLIKDFLPQKSLDYIKSHGFFNWDKEDNTFETNLMGDGACVFMGRDEIGISFCAIEKAYLKGLIDFRKPISCHLYPIRVSENKEVGFEALNYDKWDICSAACSNGEKQNIKLFEFVKDALIRKYGSEFYKELELIAEQLEKT